MKRSGFNLVELVVEIALLAVVVVILVPVLFRAGDAAKLSSCQINLRLLSSAFKMYASENRGDWPGIQAETVVEPVLASEYLPGKPAGLSRGQKFTAAAPLMRSLCPEYLTDPAILICPSDREDSLDSLRDPTTGNFAVTDYGPGGKVSEADASYVYFGYCLDKLGDGAAEVIPGKDATYGGANIQLLLTLSGIVSGAFGSDDSAGHGIVLDGTKDIELSRAGSLQTVARSLEGFDIMPAKFGTEASNKIYRLREGIENIYITDLSLPGARTPYQDAIYVMFDRFGTPGAGVERYEVIPHKAGKGCNVLYMDGHVEFVKFGTEPVCGSVGVTLGMVDL